MLIATQFVCLPSDISFMAIDTKFLSQTLILEGALHIFSSDIKIKFCHLDRNHYIFRGLATCPTNCFYTM